jgi:hypothetical protein
MSETWLSESNKDIATLPGYKSFHTVRDNRGGGVSIFVDQTFDVRRLDVWWMTP